MKLDSEGGRTNMERVFSQGKVQYYISLGNELESQGIQDFPMLHLQTLGKQSFPQKFQITLGKHVYSSSGTYTEVKHIFQGGVLRERNHPSIFFLHQQHQMESIEIRNMTFESTGEISGLWEVSPNEMKCNASIQEGTSPYFCSAQILFSCQGSISGLCQDEILGRGS